jgi:hypothetical protein
MRGALQYRIDDPSSVTDSRCQGMEGEGKNASHLLSRVEVLALNCDPPLVQTGRCSKQPQLSPGTVQRYGAAQSSRVTNLRTVLYCIVLYDSQPHHASVVLEGRLGCLYH